MIHTDHTFAICAYKESEYLEECIKSALNQTIKTNVLIATSTPNEYISNLADKYDIPVYINTGGSGIAQDWNFAYLAADTEYVTITHQDDVYGETYVENLISYFKLTKNPLIFFTDYGELRGDSIITTNKNLKIKRVMLFAMRNKAAWKSKFIRRRMLSLGSAICCPSVTFAKSNLPKELFSYGYRASVDWQAWEKLSKMKGEFIFCNKILMYHRIHGASETTKALEDNKRIQEDYEMFCCFWPKWIAKILTKLYSKSEESNAL